MSAITEEEVAAWVIENAGKVAYCIGTNKSLLVGRVKGYVNAKILIENDKSQFRDNTPDPLPHIPYKYIALYLVIPKAKDGRWFSADQVRLEAYSTTAEQMILAKRINKPLSQPKIVYSDDAYVVEVRPEAIETAGRNPIDEQHYTAAMKTCHPECIYGFCHRKYMGA